MSQQLNLTEVNARLAALTQQRNAALDREAVLLGQALVKDLRIQELEHRVAELEVAAAKKSKAKR